jgi:carboxyl-terminal processing protease
MSRLLPAFFLLWAAALGQDLESQIRTFTHIYAAVEREAAEPVDPDHAIYGGAIPAMLRPLDPHSVFLDPDQFGQLQKLQESVRKGFGSVVSVLPGRVIVLQTLAGTPSARAGLAPGDEVIAINGVGLDRLDLQHLIALLEESRQKPVTLDVRRPGSVRTLQFVLTPEEMQSSSVERAFLLRPGVGYVHVTSFDIQTGAEIEKAIGKLGGRDLKALVLDLRDNPGGLVPAALETGSLFLKPGQTLLSVRGRSVAPSQEKVPDSAKPYTFPVAVLVNEKTASAAEIVAGGLQDHDRAVIVGEPSYGKGLVETVFPLSDGAGLALTTAFYYTPSGRSIQKPMPSGQLGGTAPGQAETQSEFRTDSGRVVRGGGGIQPDIFAREKPQARLQMFLDGSGSLTAFATDYLSRHPGITEAFEVTPQVLDELQGFLARRQVLPGVAEWSAVRDWITNRLKAEIFNQALGVEKGDEVEAQRDAVILAALKALDAAQ